MVLVLMWDCRARPLISSGDYFDGDSFTVLADTMFGSRYEPQLRLLDVYAPEMRAAGGPQPGAVETTAFVNNWFATLDHRRRWPLYVITTKTKTFEPTQRRTHTRYLARAWRYIGDPSEVVYDPADTLNAKVTQFLAEHPQWGGGTGAGRAA